MPWARGQDWVEAVEGEDPERARELKRALLDGHGEREARRLLAKQRRGEPLTADELAHLEAHARRQAGADEARDFKRASAGDE